MLSADTNDHNKWWTTIRQPFANHWTTIEQSLNNHWTIIEQSLNKTYSKPVQNLFNSIKYTRRFVKWNPSFWKTRPRRLGDYKSPRALQGVKIAGMGRQLRYLGVPKKRTAKGVFYFVKRKQAETVWTRRTAFLKHECSWIIHELTMNWFFEHETRECSENNETFNETINGHSWRNISCLERTLFETWEKKRKERAEKNNNFERFSGDSTLTFLTSGNTFCLVILPTRRVVFPGCASSFS